MNIRKLAVEDAERFKKLRIEASGESATSFYPSRQELTDTPAEEFRTQVTPTQTNAVFGAFENDELIAIIGVRRDRREKVRHKAGVWGLYTVPSHRGQGIARKLLTAAIDDARSHPEVTKISLSVNAENLSAKSLYISFGFTSFGIERNSMVVEGMVIHEEHMALELD